MSNFEFESIDSNTSGNVLANTQLNRYFINKGIRQNKELMEYIHETCRGSVVFTTGSGRYNLMLVAGVHGNELSSQASLVKLMDEIIKGNLRIKCKLHIIPFLIPHATMNNNRKFNNLDMNRNAHNDGVTRNVVEYAVQNKITAFCDCHSTDPEHKPGYASVFCSVKPLIQSVQIAKRICQDTSSKILPISQAALIHKGALEDELNIHGVPAVTIETVISNGFVDDFSVNFSYKQICSFLNYFGVI